MCDLWKAPLGPELAPEAYLRLPASLTDINISGGEPFLRRDLDQVVAAMKSACPRARLVVSSNGFALQAMENMLPRLLTVEPKLALRISLDGLGPRHEDIRGVKGAFEKAVAALEIAQRAGVVDLGIAVTVMECNLDQVLPLYAWARERRLDFSLTLATASEVFFGPDKDRLRPSDARELARVLGTVAAAEYRSTRPRRWLRGWFAATLRDFALGKGRALPCGAGRGFFYLSPAGEVYACHLLPSQMGDLRRLTFEELWRSPQAERVRAAVAGCEGCWMVCTAKAEMRRRWLRLAMSVLGGKFRAHIGGLVR